uniref:Uncharacterized protein n=1 Tax=Arundo donax TaxID=35708 RepID=A0A0A9G183_ARUDO
MVKLWIVLHNFM